MLNFKILQLIQVKPHKVIKKMNKYIVQSLEIRCHTMLCFVKGHINVQFYTLFIRE